MEAMNFRHACKKFDIAKKISDEDMHFILETGRKSPSSFGLEPWHFLVISNQSLKEKLRPACWNQVQITTCSHLVILLSRKAHTFNNSSSYIEESFRRKTGGNAEMLKNVKEVFANFTLNKSAEKIDDWAKMQVYLASGNMMTAAAYLHIDSCAIEGYEYHKVSQILLDEIDFYKDGNFNITYLIAFGYRINPQSKQLRKSLNEVVTFV